jgi:general secretion pathway protein A
MYTDFFQFRENPFALAPDPRFLFLSHQHKEALAHLLYGLDSSGGFVQLTGEVGTGKTTLCRSLLAQVPADVDVALILNPKLSALELVAAVCDELGIEYPADTTSLKLLVDGLTRHLLKTDAAGRRTVLVIDEAQNLSPEVLEQVRLLTNLETDTRKLLQILLVGQPELQVMMAQPQLRQLAQRVTARYHLSALSAAETAAYIRHRLEVVGGHAHLFSRLALWQIARSTRGVPRLINTICDRALLGAYARQRPRVDWRLVRSALAEVEGALAQRRRHRRLAGTLALSLLLVGIAGYGWYYGIGLKSALPPPVPTPTSDRAASAALPTVRLSTLPPADETVDLSAPAARIPTIDTMDDAGGFADFLKEAGPYTTTTTALQNLFGYWRVDFNSDEGITACEQALAYGLRCLQGNGNWTILRSINLPTILELIDRQNQRHHLAVLALTDSEVVFDLGDRRASFPLAEVGRYWYGIYLTLWRLPPSGSLLLKKGISGDDVLWLRTRLAQLDLPVQFEAATFDRQVFDEPLELAVKAFQSRHGLTADGVVGEQTMVRLLATGQDPSVPRLNTPLARGS